MNNIFKKQEIRFNEIDFLKGLAIITMIISHIFFFMNHMDMIKFNYDLPWYLFLTLFAQITFITCIGVNLSLSYQKYNSDCKKKKVLKYSYYLKQLKRVIFIAIFAVILSYLTYLTHDYKYIKFGILHFASCAIFLLMWTININLINLGYIIIVLFLYIFKKKLIGFFLNHFNEFIVFIIGIFNPKYYSLDYFPFVPWLIFACTGAIISNVIYKNYQRRFKLSKRIDKFLSNNQNLFSYLIRFCGKYSFFIYLIHIPILYLFLLFIKKTIYK